MVSCLVGRTEIFPGGWRRWYSSALFLQLLVHRKIIIAPAPSCRSPRRRAAPPKSSRSRSWTCSRARTRSRRRAGAWCTWRSASPISPRPRRWSRPACARCATGRTAYTATLGLPGAARGHCSALSRRNSEPRWTANRVAVTAGASGGLLTVAALYVDAGDEVLVPDPGYPGLPPLRARLRGRCAGASGRRGGELPADARRGARGLGGAHQGPAARLAVQSHRHADSRARAAEDRRVRRRARRRAAGRRDLPGPGLRRGAVDRARPARRSGDRSTASRSTSA